MPERKKKEEPDFIFFMFLGFVNPGRKNRIEKSLSWSRISRPPVMYEICAKNIEASIATFFSTEIERKILFFPSIFFHMAQIEPCIGITCT